MPWSTSAAVVAAPNPEPTGRCAEATLPRYGTENAATNTTGTATTRLWRVRIVDCEAPG